MYTAMTLLKKHGAFRATAIKEAVRTNARIPRQDDVDGRAVPLFTLSGREVTEAERVTTDAESGAVSLLATSLAVTKGEAMEAFLVCDKDVNLAANYLVRHREDVNPTRNFLRRDSF
jgi:hypothetical protein